MSFELLAAIVLALFPFGWQMLGLPNVNWLGAMSWSVCVVLIAHVSSNARWFKNSIYSRFPRLGIAAISSISTIIVGIVVIFAIWPHKETPPQSSPFTITDYRQWQSNQNEVISGREFVNEQVDVDGKTFDHCRFQNVTLYYHGTANTTLIAPLFAGVTMIRTDNQAVKGWQTLVSFMQSVPKMEGDGLFGVDNSGNLHMLYGPADHPPQGSGTKKPH